MATFRNGCFVSRMWGDLTDGELIAEFQYDTDATLFAQAVMESERTPRETYLVVCDANNGKVNIVRRPKKPDPA